MQQWMRFALAGVAFAVALLLTPRALLDVTDHADSHEIPVDMLEPSDDDCLWCSEVPEDFDQYECDDIDDAPDPQISSGDADDLPAECRDEPPALEPSA